MQPSIPDAKYQLQKFRHAQKAKFLESILGLKVWTFLQSLSASISCPFSFLWQGIYQASFQRERIFGKALRIVGVDGRK